MTRFRTYCSRAEQLSLAAMAQAPTPGVQGSAEQAAVPGAVSRDAEKLALLEELKESIQRMERESAPAFVSPSQRNAGPHVAKLTLEDRAPGGLRVSINNGLHRTFSRAR